MISLVIFKIWGSDLQEKIRLVVRFYLHRLFRSFSVIWLDIEEKGSQNTLTLSALQFVDLSSKL